MITDISDIHQAGIELEEGNRVLFNDRSRSLRVSNHETFPQTKLYRNNDEYHRIVLEGNGTTYHLLCWRYEENAGPMLYKATDWDKGHAHDDREYSYPRMGERVEKMQVES